MECIIVFLQRLDQDIAGQKVEKKFNMMKWNVFVSLF